MASTFINMNSPEFRMAVMAKHIRELQEENERLKEKLNKFEELVKYYAFGNLDKRKPVEFSRQEDEDLNDPEIGLFIDWDDISCCDLPQDYYMMTTGKKARKFLKEMSRERSRIQRLPK